MTSKWTAAAPLLSIFCLVGIVDSFAVSTGSVLMALGQSWLKMILNLMNGAFNILAYTIGSFWGVSGVAVAFLLSQTVYQIIPLTVLRRTLELRWGQYFSQWIKGLVVSTITATFVGGGLIVTADSGNEWTRLVIGTHVFVFLYLFLLNLLFDEQFDELISIARSVASSFRSS